MRVAAVDVQVVRVVAAVLSRRPVDAIAGETEHAIESAGRPSIPITIAAARGTAIGNNETIEISNLWGGVARWADAGVYGGIMIICARSTGEHTVPSDSIAIVTKNPGSTIFHLASGGSGWVDSRGTVLDS